MRLTLFALDHHYRNNRDRWCRKLGSESRVACHNSPPVDIVLVLKFIVQSRTRDWAVILLLHSGLGFVSVPCLQLDTLCVGGNEEYEL